MSRLGRLLVLGATTLLAATGAYANDAAHPGPVARLQGVWLTQVTIRDCVSGAALLGPFPGLITFQQGGTMAEIGPALPNSMRSPGHGTWRRTGRDTFEQALIFQRFDVTGIFLGTQVIRGNPQVAADSLTYKATGGSFEVKDRAGSTIGSGCSSVTAVRFE